MFILNDLYFYRRLPYSECDTIRRPAYALQVLSVQFEMFNQFPSATRKYTAIVLAVTSFGQKHILPVHAEVITLIPGTKFKLLSSV